MYKMGAKNSAQYNQQNTMPNNAQNASLGGVLGVNNPRISFMGVGNVKENVQNNAGALPGDRPMAQLSSTSSTFVPGVDSGIDYKIDGLKNIVYNLHDSMCGKDMIVPALGSKMDRLNVSDDACALLCSSTDGCKGFSYDQLKRYCVLKNNLDDCVGVSNILTDVNDQHKFMSTNPKDIPFLMSREDKINVPTFLPGNTFYNTLCFSGNGKFLCKPAGALFN